MENAGAANPSVNERMKIYKEAIEKLEKHMSDRIGRSVQFTNLYFVFQGMVFSYFKPSSPKINCKLKWIPFTLSLLVSIFNFLAVWENIAASLKLYKELVDYWKKLDKERVQQHVNPRAPRPAPTPADVYAKRILQRKAMSYLTMLLLFVFMGVMLCGCLQIECGITAVVA